MRARVVSAVSAVASLALAGACVYFFYRGYGIWCIAPAVAMIFALPAASSLHELGHMLFGAAVKIKAKPSFSFLSPSSCEIVPERQTGLKGALIITVIGGLFVNLLFIVLGAVALAVNAVPVWLAVFLPSSFYIFALNVAPMYLPAGKTDGLVLYGLLNGDDESKVMLAVAGAHAQLAQGKRIEELDEKLLFGLPQIREDDESFIALTELRRDYLKARGDARAEIYAERLEELKRLYL